MGGSHADEIGRRVEEAGLDLSDGVVCCEVCAVVFGVDGRGGWEVERLGECLEGVVCHGCWFRLHYLPRYLGAVLTVLGQLEADFPQGVGFPPLELTSRHGLRPTRRREDAVLEAACLGVGRVKAVELLLELGELILKMQQQTVVEGLELSVDRFDGWSFVAL